MVCKHYLLVFNIVNWVVLMKVKSAVVFILSRHPHQHTPATESGCWNNEGARPFKPTSAELTGPQEEFHRFIFVLRHHEKEP